MFKRERGECRCEWVGGITGLIGVCLYEIILGLHIKYGVLHNTIYSMYFHMFLNICENKYIVDDYVLKLNSLTVTTVLLHFPEVSCQFSSKFNVNRTVLVLQCFGYF